MAALFIFGALFSLGRRRGTWYNAFMKETGQTKRLYVAGGDNPAMMVRRILERMKPETGLKPDAAIGLKPNLVVSKGWQSGATTNPAICAAVIEYFFERGFKNLVIIESSWLAVDTARAYKDCGYDKLAHQYGVELIDVKKDRYQTREFDGMRIDISACAMALDLLINLPLIKGHCQTGMTCALKNMKGLIPDREKRRFHTMGLHKPIAYLNRMISPSLTIADGTCTDPSFEEGGDPAYLGMMVAGYDSVLVDTYAAGLLGLRPTEIEYIQTAAHIGVGSADLTGAEIVYLDGASHAEAVTRSATLDAAKACVDADQSCSACYSSLISALLRLAETKPLDDMKICIGQGYKGKAGILGCGTCTAGFHHSIEGCPPSADDIYEQLLQYTRRRQ
jgi:uncharacterized protein (DUF362 family)